MTEEQVYTKLEELDGKVEAVYASVEKTRRYFLWTLIISLAVIVLPLIGTLLLIPRLISSYESLVAF